VHACDAELQVPSSHVGKSLAGHGPESMTVTTSDPLSTMLPSLEASVAPSIVCASGVAASVPSLI
jgi:hypothetical protein